jgi:hypothetical protein
MAGVFRAGGADVFTLEGRDGRASPIQSDFYQILQPAATYRPISACGPSGLGASKWRVG